MYREFLSQLPQGSSIANRRQPHPLNRDADAAAAAQRSIARAWPVSPSASDELEPRAFDVIPKLNSYRRPLVQSNPVFSVKILKERGKDGRSAIGSEVTTMRKTILGHESQPATSSSNEWLGVEAIAGIGVTSEAEDAPVENVLYPAREVGWRAGEPGPQIIQITFGGPTNIRHIQLLFRESQFARTQEFTLRCSVAGGERREVTRQQWTFSPQGSTEEVEDYRVTLDDVTVLELAIIPDISKGGVHASLVHLRIG